MYLKEKKSLNFFYLTNQEQSDKESAKLAYHLPNNKCFIIKESLVRY